MASSSAAARRFASSSSSLLSTDLKWAVGGWLFFIAENAILSENRTALIDFLGDDDMYHAVYGTCSTAACVSILYGYRKIIRRQPAAPITSALRLGVGGMTMSMGLILASQALPKLQVPVTIIASEDDDKTKSSVTEEQNSSPQPQQQQPWRFKVRCPFDFTDKHNNTADQQEVVVTGLDRVSRHPGLWAFGLTVAGNAALQPTLPLTIFMLGPAAVALLGGAHTDSRYRRGLGGTMDPNYERQTSNIPFVAMLTGQQGEGALQTWLMNEFKPLNAAISVAVACAWVVAAAASRGKAVGSSTVKGLARKAIVQ